MSRISLFWRPNVVPMRAYLMHDSVTPQKEGVSSMDAVGRRGGGQGNVPRREREIQALGD